MDSFKFTRNQITILQTLQQAKVEYMVVGGYAVRYYGYPRSTRDLDLWTGTRRPNAEKISQLMHTWIPEHDGIQPELFEHPNRIIRFSFPVAKVEILDPIIGQKPKLLNEFHGEMSGQIEILTIQTGVEFYECFGRRQVALVDGVQINLISLPELLKIKQAGDRIKDRDDLAHLL